MPRNKKRDERKVFVDTSAIAALVNEQETNHNEAQRVFQLLTRNKYEIFVSNYVVSETHAFVLNRSRIRDPIQRVQFGLGVLNDFYDENKYTVLFVSEQDEKEARQTLARYRDKIWSLSDMTSFLIMDKRGIPYFFSFDNDFYQASGSFSFEDVIPFLPEK